MNVPVSPRDLPIPEDSSAKGQGAPLDSHEWRQLDAYWRAANYLSVGQIYLYANPLLREPFTLAHVKPLVVGHWGTTPGQNFIYVHLNRTIRLHDLDMIYIAGPGHGGPALVANTYLEGSYSEIYPGHQPGRSRNETALQTVFVSWRHFEPCRPDDARVDPRGRRTRIFAEPRLWRRIRQPGAHCRLHRRRRRSRNGSLGDRLAIQQIPQSDHGRSGSADLAPQRLQNQQPDNPRPRRARGTRKLLQGMRLDAAVRRG